MSHADELGATPYRRSNEAAAAEGIGRGSFDWTILVIALALVATVGWVCLLLWGAARVVLAVVS